MNEEKDSVDLMTTTDARVWAEEFMELANKREIDKEIMETWFSSSILVGKFSNLPTSTPHISQIKEEIRKTVTKFDTNFYVKNAEREFMIAEVITQVNLLVDANVKAERRLETKVASIVEERNKYYYELKEIKDESIWQAIKRIW